MAPNADAAPEDSGQLEIEGHTGTWQVKDGTLTVTCLTMGIAPKSAKVQDNADFLARLLMQEMHREWKLTRP
ncbi:hypothetical protein LJR118_003410 [Acidovorax sp. LjRoot118]|uniref:hypothetical protein n=1 Tax=Acidovorax sp. LjRoot118 TaxID=3342256 RepID=UPI003ECCEB88